jgi:hypothetical protein
MLIYIAARFRVKGLTSVIGLADQAQSNTCRYISIHMRTVKVHSNKTASVTVHSKANVWPGNHDTPPGDSEGFA